MKTLLLIWENFYFQCIFKVILISILAGIIGMERDKSNKPAGFRTYTLLGISAVLVVLCGQYLSEKFNGDSFRIAAQFLSGIGFIGAGTILTDGFNVKGLTTASGLLAVSCIGLCVGAGFYFIAIFSTVITYLVLSSSYLFTDKLDHFDLIELELDTYDDLPEFMMNLEKFSEKYELEFKQIKDISEENCNYNSIKLVCKYNNKMLTKNKILTEIASIQNIRGISEILK